MLLHLCVRKLRFVFLFANLQDQSCFIVETPETPKTKTVASQTIINMGKIHSENLDLSRIVDLICSIIFITR